MNPATHIVNLSGGKDSQAEADYIQRFDPPWNIIGRRRGLVS